MRRTIKDEQLVQLIRDDIDRASEYYEQYVRPTVEENIQLYKGDPEYYAKLMPEISKRSKFVSTDIADAVETMIAQLMKIFFGSDDVITISGRTAEDEEPAEVLQELCNFQINRLNDGFMAFYRWFKDALAKDYGVLKIVWDRQYEYDKYEEVISIDELMALQQDEDVEILETTDLGKAPDANGLLKQLYRVKYKAKRVIKNQPKFEVVPYYEFLFDPNAKSQNDMRYAIHRKLVTADYLRKKQDEGIYRNIEKAIEQGNVDNAFMENIENYQKFQDDSEEDSARKYITIYEYWGKVDVNEDGRLEDIVCTIANDVVLSVQENTLGGIPFALLSPIIENDSPLGKGFASMLAQLQNLKTMLIKELAYNIALANDGRMFINQDFVNINDLLGGAKYIRTKGNVPMSQIVMPVPFGNIHGATFNALEYIDTVKENRSGITRYNQGLDARSLNKRIDINTPVPMADGTWKLLKDVCDGDLILGGDGNPTKVIKAHEIKFCDNAYELEFSNGAKIVADGEHLWGVFVYDRYQVLNTEQVKEKLEEGKPLYIPRPKGIYSGKEKGLSIDPYVLGVWLGDGHKYSSRITLADGEIVDRVKEWCEWQGWSVKEDKHQNAGKAKTYLITSKTERIRDKKGQFVKEDSFHRRLSELGVYPRTGGEPHIPAEYFTASYKQRLELLRGLMDTDGCWGEGIAIFCSSNRRLAEDVVKLVRSLGGNPHLRKSRKKGKDVCVGRICNIKEHWHVNFNIFDCPFFVSRKADRWKAPKKQKTYKIVAIRKAEGRLMRCLTVDNPDGLWLVGEQYITTHNTATGISLIMQAANQRMELIARIFAETGVKRFYRLLLSYNLRFIDEEQVYRLTNKPMKFTEDFEGKFDFIVNAGVGVAQKQETLATLQKLLEVQLQVLVPMGLAKPENIYNTVSKMLELSGLKDVDSYIVNIDKFKQEQQQAAAMMQMQGGQNAGQTGAVTGANQPIPEGQANTGVMGKAQGAPGEMQGADLQGMAAMLQSRGMGSAQGGA